MLDRVCDTGVELYFLGDLNVDWKSESCALKNKLLSLANACNLCQLVSDFTRVNLKSDA